MRITMAHTAEMCNCWVPRRLKRLCGREVNDLPQKSSKRTHLRIEDSEKRPKEEGREEEEVFSGAQRLGVFRPHLGKDLVMSGSCFSLTVLL